MDVRGSLLWEPIAEAMYVGAVLCDLSYSSHVHIATVESCTRCTVVELQLRGAVTLSYSASKCCDAHHRCLVCVEEGLCLGCVTV